LVADRAAALEFPTGDVILMVCEDCSFVFNAAWDPQRTVYSDQYEETQGFSPTFKVFHHAIAADLIESYGIRDKTVLEIGCGKGEFLSLICQIGGNRGIGYDPSFVPIRQQGGQNLRFVREFFTSRTREESPDLLCCKMTLEHIGHTRQFIDAVRAVATREDSLIFFQVPDVRRIFKETAFWDIYYEHCSYFGAASLDRLFTAAGFSIRRVWSGYDDQYLMIVASPGGQTIEHADNVDEAAAVVRAADRFAAEVGRCRAAWLRRFRDWAGRGQRTVLWGSGSKAVALLTTLGVRDEIQYAVDINPYRVGKFLPGTGQQIVAPCFLRHYQPDNVVIMNPIYRVEIAQELERLRCAAQLYTILDYEPGAT
jgi:hypothetical protein